MANVSFIDAQGARQQADIHVGMYRDAAREEMSLPDYLARQFPTDTAQYGSTFQQMMASCGMFMANDPANGIRKARIGDIMEGTLAGTVVRDPVPASRILFPATILEVMEDRLKADSSGDVAIFNSMVAVEETINGSRWEQPVISMSKPEAARSQPISQLAEPSTMLTLTVSDKASTVPSFGIGMVIAEQAMKATALDFVTLSLARQAEAERAALIDGWINSLLNGDADFGLTALPTVKANTFDSSISAAGQLTHKAWVKWLRRNYRKRAISHIICDIDTYMSILGRTGRPLAQDRNDGGNERLVVTTDPLNPGLPNPQVYIVETGVVPANTIMGFDARYAIRKVRNLQADYQAAEDMVMRRGQALRFDWSEMATRLYDDAFDVLTLVP